MDRLLIALCLFVGVHSFIDELHHLMKRQADSDMIQFTPEVCFNKDYSNL